MDEKIILDEQSFKALSANSRVSILKKLNERRMTLSELSKRIGLKGPTVKEHCTILQNAELIKKIDEGRKWKYYELTGKGKQIVAPSILTEAKMLVTLCISAIVFVGILLFALQATMGMSGASYSFQTSEKGLLEDTLFTNQAPLADTVGATSDNIANEVEQKDTFIENNTNIIVRQPVSEPNPFIPIGLIGMLVVGIIIGWVARKKL